jgi:hypothetical protein
MADTERELVTLLALYADNTTKRISPQDGRDFLVSTFGGYAHLAVIDNATSQGSLSDVTPVKLTAFNTNGEATGLTPDHTTDDIAVAVAGKYQFTICVSFDGTVNTTYEFQPGVDGVATPVAKAHRKIGAANDVGSAACSGILDLAVGEKVSVMVSILDTPVAQTITVRQGCLTMKRVG